MEQWSRKTTRPGAFNEPRLRVQLSRLYVKNSQPTQRTRDNGENCSFPLLPRSKVLQQAAELTASNVHAPIAVASSQQRFKKHINEETVLLLKERRPPL